MFNFYNFVLLYFLIFANMKDTEWFKKREILTKDLVSEMLGVSCRTVDNYIKRNNLPVHKPAGESPYFLFSEVYEWIKKG